MPFVTFLKYCAMAFGGALLAILLLAVLGAQALAFALGVIVFALGLPATFVSYAVIRGLRSAPASKGTSSPSGESNTARQMPIGIFIYVGMVLTGAILVFLAGKRVFTASPPTDADIHFVVTSAIVGIVLLIVGFIGWGSACPNCHLIGTSEILASNNLGSHMETRKESRTARHYGRDGIEQSSTTYEADVPVQVTVHRHIKHCKKCGHIWSTTSRTES